jgi:hypothetical protein
MKKKLLLFFSVFILSITLIGYSSSTYSPGSLAEFSGLKVSEEYKLKLYRSNDDVFDIQSNGTFPLPDPIQLRSIIILLFGSIPIGIIFLILLYRSRKRRKRK